jgi:hypothetical protein
MTFTKEDIASILAAEAEDRSNGILSYPTRHEMEVISAPRIATLDEFTRVDEPGAEALLGDAQEALIPEGGDVMVYGNGGAGKTTLLFDLACHLAAGEEWLGIPVRRPVRILIIENEGPRALLRRKLKRKQQAWRGPPFADRISVLENPWGEFTFAEESWRDRLASIVRDHEIDVLIAGPLTRLGMDSAGTLQETAAFMKLVGDVRQSSCRLLTSIIAHHENRAGSVSGAWEGAGDTLLHVHGADNGHTVVHVQKARWASRYHGQTLKLAWTEGEGFTLEGGDRDLIEELRDLLAANPWRTSKEIAQPVAGGGIGANEKTVKQLLEQHEGSFERRTGKAAMEVGRKSASAIVWGLRHGSDSPNSPGGALEGAGGGESGESPVEGLTLPSAPPPQALRTESPPQLIADLNSGEATHNVLTSEVSS